MDAQPLTESLRETLALFEEAGVPLTTAEVTERLDLGRRAVYARLRRLVEQDRLETKKVGASARVWWQPRATAGDSRDVARPDEHEREPRNDRDDTGRDDPERALARYETLFEESKDVNVVVGTDGRFQHVTQSAANVFGYDAEALVGEVGFEYIHPDDRATAMEEFSKMIETPGYEPKIEFRFEHSDGSWIVVEALGRNLLDDPDIGGIVVYTRDVTERTERERELRDRVRQQEVVTDLGRRALETRDVDALMAEAAELVAETLETDYSKVLDLDEDAEELLLRHGVGWDDGVVGSATVSAVEDDSQAAYTLATETPVVVKDLAAETRFSGPELLRSHDVRGGISTIIGPVSDPWGVLGTHDTERRTFSEHDANFVQSVATIIATAVDRRTDERELIVQRERLAALNSLGGVVRGITESVIDQSTREEIEAAVCNRLADSESYLFAWVGDADTTAGTVRLRTEAGVDGYLDDVSISVDPDDERGEGPTGRAFRTGEIQTTRDVDSDPRYEPWRDHAREHGFRSSAAIPITHDDTVYGVLNLYTERRNAFEREEREMVAQVGEVVGHAIAAVERKQALMSDELVELGFRVREAFGSIDAPVGTTGTIALDHTVPVGDGTFLAYGTAPAEAVDSLDAIVGAFPHWESVTIRSEGDRVGFEARLTDPPVLSVVASLGGYVDRTEIENGTYRMVVHLAPNVDVNRVVDVVEETYPGAELFRRRQIDREHDDLQRRQRRPAADLTDRQRTALEVAYHAGFFEWPRDASGEEVADSIGIAPSTFHQHLRKAERAVFDTMFSHPVPDSG